MNAHIIINEAAEKSGL